MSERPPSRPATIVMPKSAQDKHTRTLTRTINSLNLEIALRDAQIARLQSQIERHKAASKCRTRTPEERERLAKEVVPLLDEMVREMEWRDALLRKSADVVQELERKLEVASSRGSVAEDADAGDMGEMEMAREGRRGTTNESHLSSSDFVANDLEKKANISARRTPLGERKSRLADHRTPIRRASSPIDLRSRFHSDENKPITTKWTATNERASTRQNSCLADINANARSSYPRTPTSKANINFDTPGARDTTTHLQDYEQKTVSHSLRSASKTPTSARPASPRDRLLQQERRATPLKSRARQEENKGHQILSEKPERPRSRFTPTQAAGRLFTVIPGSRQTSLSVLSQQPTSALHHVHSSVGVSTEKQSQAQFATPVLGQRRSSSALKESIPMQQVQNRTTMSKGFHQQSPIQLLSREQVKTPKIRNTLTPQSLHHQYSTPILGKRGSSVLKDQLEQSPLYDDDDRFLISSPKGNRQKSAPRSQFATLSPRYPTHPDAMEIDDTSSIVSSTIVHRATPTPTSQSSNKLRSYISTPSLRYRSDFTSSAEKPQPHSDPRPKLANILDTKMTNSKRTSTPFRTTQPQEGEEGSDEEMDIWTRVATPLAPAPTPVAVDPEFFDVISARISNLRLGQDGTPVGRAAKSSSPMAQSSPAVYEPKGILKHKTLRTVSRSATSLKSKYSRQDMLPSPNDSQEGRRLRQKIEEGKMRCEIRSLKKRVSFCS